jgi:anti-sigma factor RsiW
MTEDDPLCPHAASLSALLDGELSFGEYARLCKHLDVCPRCAAELDDLKWVRAQVRSLPTRKVPDGLWGVDAPVHADRRGGGRRRPEQLVLAGLLVAAAVAGGVARGGGGDATPRVVDVPVDVFVSDHVVRTGAGPILTPLVTQE